MFSLFGKKKRDAVQSVARDAKPRPVGHDQPFSDAASNATHEAGSGAFSDRAPEPDIPYSFTAFSTVKIDAIESEMADLLARGTSSMRPSVTYAPAEFRSGASEAPDTDSGFVPLKELDATYFLTGTSRLGGIAIADNSSAQLIDEAAILYANRQDEIVEQMLRDGILEDRLDTSTRTAWLMLLDLHRVSGRLEAFEELALGFAAKFETSPPAWQDLTGGAASHDAPDSPGTPLVLFSGRLNGAITGHLTRVQDLAKQQSAMRLDFHRVTEVDPIGCGLLLRTLQRVRRPEFNLTIVGASELAGNIRSILRVGRRDETEAPWLLLLEILRLLNRESEFEEVSMEYCVTFEVSPPPFDTSESTLITAEDERPAADDETAPVVMPPVVDGKIDDLLGVITDQALLHQPLVIDCSRLVRVEFSAAGQLVDGLTAVCAAGANIEFRDVNHLVAALFRVIGLDGPVRIQLRRT